MTSKVWTDNSAQNEIGLQWLRDLVTSRGGTFIGIQVSLNPMIDSQLWFKNPATGHNLFIRVNHTKMVAADLVPQIEQAMNHDTADHMNRKVGIPVRVLRDLSAKLLKLSEEIDALYEEKKQ